MSNPLNSSIDYSISFLEFVFDLNFDEIIFPENPIKIV